MSRVLIDYHHASLAESMHLLFEDRLGHEVYVPSGLDWYEQGYWQFGKWTWGDDRLARQFLLMPDVHPQYPQRKYRLITLDEFRALDDWGYIVASVPDNERGYHRLAKEVGAKYVLTVGNTNQAVDWSLDPLALVSSEMPIVGRGVRVHQEMGPEYGYSRPIPKDRPDVASFVNCFSSMGPCFDLWTMAQHSAGEWLLVADDGQTTNLGPRIRFHESGIDGRDGIVEPSGAVAAMMTWADFGWHDKIHGDGFGHVIHGWAAIGRPLIGHASHYAGKMAGPLWEDGVTAIDLDRHTVPEVVALIREIAADPVRHEAMCRAIRARFEELVDYEREAVEIAALLA